MITLAHIAITQADIEEQGSAHVRDDALTRVREAIDKELAARPRKPSSVIRIDVTVADE